MNKWGHQYVKAAVDIALWDLAGKIYNARVCGLLGDAKQGTVPSYYAIGLTKPEKAVAIAKGKAGGRVPVSAAQGRGAGSRHRYCGNQEGV
jgi:L-alanine-DL-glutamate epimerase-like enolase superfamily enzyme